MKNVLKSLRKRRTIAILMALVMVLTLVPVIPSAIANTASIQIDRPGTLGLTDLNPIVINQNTYRLTGTFSGMNVTNLSYIVKNIGTNHTESGGTPYNPPGTQQFVYENIIVTPGVNEIIIQSTTGQSANVFVQYNDMPGIFDIKVNGNDMLGDELVLTMSITPGQTLAGSISGIATNATQVTITNQTLYGTNPNASITAQVFGTMGSFAGAIPLQAGENKIVFVAANATKSVVEERRVIVNVLTAGASLNVYNLQSHVRNDPDYIVKNVPRDGQVDLQDTEEDIDRKVKKPYATTDEDLQFTGKLLINPGAGYAEINEFRTAQNGQRVYSDLEFELQKYTNGNFQTVTVGALSILNPSTITSNTENPQRHIEADQAVFAFQQALIQIRPTITTIKSYTNTADVAIGLNNYNNISTSAITINTLAGALKPLLSTANNALDAVSITTFGALGIDHLTTKIDNVHAAVDDIDFDETDRWIDINKPDPSPGQLAALRTAVTELEEVIIAIDTTPENGSTRMQKAFADITTQMKASNAMITKSDGESMTSLHVYDFVTPVIPASSIAYDHNARYRLVIVPKLYKNNPATQTDYATFANLAYEFTYINSQYPVITSWQNADTNELIFHKTTTQTYRVAQTPFSLKLNLKNITTGASVTAKFKNAPYQQPIGPDFTGTVTNAPVIVSGTDGYVLLELPGMLTGNNLIEVTYTNSDGTVTDYREVLVVTTPLVNVIDGEGQALASNKVYEYDYINDYNDYPSPNAFLQEKFGKVRVQFSGVSTSKPLGTGVNPIKVFLNNVPVGTVTVPVPGTVDHISVIDTLNSAVATIDVNLYNFHLAGGIDQRLAEGLNRIRIEFNNGATPISVEIPFYVFTVGFPEISNIRVTDNMVTNHPIKLDEGYTSDADEITINATIKRATKGEVYIQGELAARYEHGSGANWNLALMGIAPGVINITGDPVSIDGATLTINNYPLVNPSDSVLQGTFIFRIEATEGNTTTSRPVAINKRTEPYTVLAPYRQVVNNNFQKIIIRSDSAESVSIGKLEAERIRLNANDSKSVYVKDWLESRLYGSNASMLAALGSSAEVFFAEVPLKSGNNKISVTVNFGSQQVTGVIEVYYAASAQPGAVFKTDLSKNRIRPKELEDKIELSFPKGTLLQKKDLQIQGEYEQYEKYYEIPNFWADKQVLIAVADKETGKVDRDINKSTREDLRASLTASYYNNYFQYASDLFYVDAGDIENPGGRLPYESPMIVSRNNEIALEPNKQGTITLAYNPSIVRDAGPHMAVMYNPGYTSIGNQTGWVNLGGIVNDRNNTVTVPFEGFGYYTVMKLNRTFNDVIFHSWGRRNLEAMFAKGIMVGEPGTNRFGTDLNISRGEFVTMLIKALNIPLNSGPYQRIGVSQLRPANPSFDDILPGMGDFFWQYEYLETAARAGIIQGRAPGLFFPNEQLTREQAAVIIARAIEARVARTPEAAMSQLTKDFTDAMQIDTYARQAVAAIARTGIVVGKQNDPNDVAVGFSFLPKNNLTRAEAAVVASRLMQQQKLLPDPL